MINKNLSTSKLSIAIEKTLKRFPMVCLFAMIGTIMALMMIHSDSESHPKFLFTSIVAVPLFLSLSLYANSKKMRSRHLWRIRLPSIILLSIIFFVLPDHLDMVFMMHFAPIFIAAHLLVSFAAFTQSGYILAFWQFNKILFLRLLLSLIITLVLSVGINVATYSIGQLFNVAENMDWSNQVYILCFGIINTLIFLYGVPDKTFKQEEYDYPVQLRRFALYILCPLLGLYTLVLYTYLFKILIQSTYPNGWVVYLVLGYAAFGFFVLLLLYPIKKKEPFIRKIYPVFYIILLPLLGMLSINIWKRVLDYGLTENRYYVIALTIWLVLVSFYFLLSKSKNIKIIPVTLFLTCFLSTIGPWSARAISIRSQRKQFAKVLEKEEMLGKKRNKISIKKGHEAFSEYRLNSIIEYLGEREALLKLQPFFDTDFQKMWEVDTTDFSKTYQVSNLLNHLEKGAAIQSVRFITEENHILEIALYNYYFHFSTLQDAFKRVNISGTSEEIICHANFALGDNHLLFFDNQQHLLADIKLDDFLDNLWEIKKNDRTYCTQGEMTLMSQSNDVNIKIVFESVMTSKYDRMKYELENISAHIMINIDE